MPAHRFIVFSFLLLIPTLTMAAGEPFQPTVAPDQLTTVRLSNSDMNRISCPGPISDVLSSSEKGVVITITGNDAFIKFKVQSGDPPLYRETPTELFVVCQGSTYSLVGLPQRIPAQTIRLSPPQRDAVEQNRARFEGLPFEQRLVRLVQDLQRFPLPESFEQQELHDPPKRYQELLITPLRRISVPGEGFVAYRYRLTAQTPVTVLEQTLLEQRLVPNPVAIALEKEQLEAGESIELLIIAQRHGKQGAVEPLIGLPAISAPPASPAKPGASPVTPLRTGLEVPHARRP